MGRLNANGDVEGHRISRMYNLESLMKWRILMLFAGATGMAFGQSAEQLYSQRCAACHGGDAAGTDRGPSLDRSRRLRTRTATEIHDIIHNGTPGGMPAFPLPEPELQA